MNLRELSEKEKLDVNDIYDLAEEILSKADKKVEYKVRRGLSYLTFLRTNKGRLNRGS